MCTDSVVTVSRFRKLFLVIWVGVPVSGGGFGLCESYPVPIVLSLTQGLHIELLNRISRLSFLLTHFQMVTLPTSVSGGP